MDVPLSQLASAARAWDEQHLDVEAAAHQVADAPTGGFTAEGFRTAWLVQYPVWAVAVVGLLVSRRSARRLHAARGVAPRPLRELLPSRSR